MDSLDRLTTPVLKCLSAVGLAFTVYFVTTCNYKVKCSISIQEENFLSEILPAFLLLHPPFLCNQEVAFHALMFFFIQTHTDENEIENL